MTLARPVKSRETYGRKADAYGWHRTDGRRRQWGIVKLGDLAGRPTRRNPCESTFVGQIAVPWMGIGGLHPYPFVVRGER